MSSVRLDLGSAELRVADQGGVRTQRLARQDPPIRRGRVVDQSALACSLDRLVPGLRCACAVLAVPAGSASDGWDRALETARSALGARAVKAVPAPVAAIRGSQSVRAGIVVDLGAELTEVSWAELSGFYVGASLPWGVRDVRADLAAHLRTAHLVEVADEELRDRWAGGAVLGRCLETGEERQLRIEAEDVETVLAPRVAEVRELVRRLERMPWASEEHPVHLVVGGGAALRPLRRGLLADGHRRWTVPVSPALTVLRGLGTR